MELVPSPTLISCPVEDMVLPAKGRWSALSGAAAGCGIGGDGTPPLLVRGTRVLEYSIHTSCTPIIAIKQRPGVSSGPMLSCKGEVTARWRRVAPRVIVAISSNVRSTISLTLRSLSLRIAGTRDLRTTRAAMHKAPSRKCIQNAASDGIGVLVQAVHEVARRSKATGPCHCA